MPSSAPALPRVSVITVTYNAAATLPTTLDSIFQQTYPHIELVIIDGASTDGTVDLVKRASGAVHQFMSEPDAGLYDAMNKGLARATGDYVWFINAGDSIATADTLDGIMAIAQREHVTTHAWPDVLYGQTALVDAAGTDLGLRTYKQLPDELSAADLRLGMVVSHQALLVRRAIATRYDLRYRIAADIDWTIRVLRAAKQVTNTGLIHVRFLVGGTSSKHRWTSWIERWHILRRQFGLLSALSAHVQIAWDSLLKPGR